MSTTTNGQAPGLVAPENDEGIVTGQGNNPQNTTNNSAEFKSKVIAVCARLSGATSQFCLEKMIAWQSGALEITTVIVYGSLLHMALGVIHHG